MFESGLVKLVLLLLVASIVITDGPFWYGWHLKGSGRYAAALKVANALGAIPTAPHRRWGRQLRASVLADSGRTDEAVAEIRAMLEALPERICPWSFVNTAVDVFVNAGLYNEAITVHRKWSVEAQELGRKKDPSLFTVTQVNRAEALHNLGRDDEALAILTEVEKAPKAGPLGRNGGLCLRAWIHAASSNAVEAREALDAVNVEPLVAGYLPELYYTRSLLALVDGKREQALMYAKEGLNCARRASSKRNGLFLLGKVEQGSGDLEAARAHLEQGATHAYRAQAADGLFTLANVYSTLGLTDERNATLKLLIERDAESRLAARARDLLAREDSNL